MKIQQHLPLAKIIRRGVEESAWEDIYHRLLRMSWPRFFLFLLAFFLGMNALFGGIYYLIPGSIANIKAGDYFSNFAFSVQTTSTIGYGYFYPQTDLANGIVTLEAALGMFFVAMLTGLVFAKFARPTSRIVFSNNVLWTTQNGQPVMSLRLGNMRTNGVFEGRAELSLLRSETSQEGERLRRIVDLKLVRSSTPLFAMSWTLFHVIDSSSPFFGKTLQQVQAEEWELIVTFLGHDQDVAQTIAAQTIYPADRIIGARKFADMIELSGRTRIIDFSKLHEVEL